MYGKFLLICFTGLIFNLSYGQQPVENNNDALTKNIPLDTFFQLILKKNADRNIEGLTRLYSIKQLSGNTFIVSQNQLSKLASFQEWFYVSIPINNQWKFSESANNLKRKGLSKQAFTFYIQVSSASFADSIHKDYPDAKTHLLKTGNKFILTVKCTLKEATQWFLNNPQVELINVITTKPVTELGVPGFDLSANKITVAQNEFPLINGEGQEVSIKEESFDTTDIDIKGRIVYSPLAATSITNHANFMATIIAGAGNSVNYAKGVAPATLVSSSSFEPILPDADEYYTARNIFIQNHSYGAVIDNSYGLNAVAFDKSANSNPNLLHVFSSGNSGNLASTSGIYTGIEGYANLTGNFKMAKNIITVGAVDSFGNVVPLSSAGPAYDGRIKPELTAFQYNGTSESAALVSGTCLLLQQYYQSLHQTPMASALAKAILVNSADDIGNIGPDYKTGFGNLNAYKAMQSVKNNNIISSEFNSQNSQSFSIIVPPNASLLKATLVWNDTTATVNSSTALVNDLDLEIVDNNTNTHWQPWALSSYPSLDSLKSQAVRRRDSINNIEQVTIENPSSGNYSINVKPHSLPAGHQSFYIVYSIDTVNHFRWERLSKQDFAEAGAKTLLRWNTSINGSGNIEYSLADNNWITLANNVSLGDKNFYWSVPDTLSRSQLRMNIDGRYFYSDTFFITTLAQPTTGFICSDSVLIYWKKTKGANNYQLYKLGEKYLEPFQTVADTSVVVNKNLLDNYFIAVAAMINNVPSIKSYAFDYTKQGAGCYINSFYINNNGNTANLNLNLGTLLNVTAIDFEKLVSNAYSPIASIPVTSSLTYVSNFTPLNSGVNLFRAKITLSNGQVIYSNPEAVFYAAPGEYILFPKPVKRGGSLTIISASPNGEQFVLTDATGRQVLQKTITSVQDYISTSSLQAGIYFYRVIKNNERITTGKLLILQ